MDKRVVKYKTFNLCGLKCKFKQKKYYDYKTIHYLLAMLKAYGLKYAIGSPGTQNANFNYILQESGSIKFYSVVDERSAGYIANGIYNETNEPVIITCTGSSASRNYLPAMTEAFYRKVPIIAITFYDYDSTIFSVKPQFVDRSTTQNDVKYLSVELPRILDDNDKKRCLTYLNAALSTAFYKHLPVHINCPSSFDFDIEKIKNLPEDIWKNDYFTENFDSLKDIIATKKTAIYIGSHKKFTEDEQKIISNFAESNSIPIFCDHMAHYKGKNRIMSAQAIGMKNLKNRPEIVIDIGEVSGEFYALNLLSNTEIWRISQDGKFTYRFNFPVAKFFDCKEKYFFKLLTNNSGTNSGYYNSVKSEIEKITEPDLPLCNSFIVQNLAKYIPKGSSLHHSVSNTKRNMNFHEFDDSIDITCNIGVCGIDGSVSTMVGQSLAAKNKKVFGIVGDLAFFYDMNALGQRDITNNLRILLINNFRGEEFRLNPILEDNIGEKSDILISAQGHNKGGVKGWAESCGFHYLNANTKEMFVNNIKQFCLAEFDKPVIFEVFTNDKDEKNGLKLMQTFNKL
ncbi:MAG: hypothetical protein LUG16_02025 [Candidatus Gastranaerophilales bacterium]|nr:hypothetical protein [Candidatus Gastranaerophilales bacterium]